MFALGGEINIVDEKYLSSGALESVMRIKHFLFDFKRFRESILCVYVLTFNKSNFNYIYLRWELERKARGVIFSPSSLFYRA